MLGSQQLFTEHTLTPIMPLLHQWSAGRLRNVARLWMLVLAANLLGTLLFATALAYLNVIDPLVTQMLSDLARETLDHSAGSIVRHAVYAGWLIALMVWMLPAAESSKILVIVLMTYLVGLGGFAHIVAGSAEVFFAALRGEATIGRALFGFIQPTLAGSVAGGVTIVAALNHAQATSGSGDRSAP